MSLTTEPQAKSAMCPTVLLSIVGMMMAPARVCGVIESQRPAAMLRYPLVLVQDDGPGQRVDTEIELANTRDDRAVRVQCFYVDGSGRCSTDTTTECFEDGHCAGEQTCVFTCPANSFVVQLTPRQALGWVAGQGLSALPCSVPDRCPDQINHGSIPPVANRFTGGLECIELSTEIDGIPGVPVARNDLIGAATIVQRRNAEKPLASAYSAIGVEAVGSNNGDRELTLGGPAAEYEPCPDTLTGNVLFDGAVLDGTSGKLGLVAFLMPCARDFATQRPVEAIADVRIFNEFEQRSSLRLSVKCSHIMSHDLLHIALQGTLSGQIRIRGSRADGSEHAEPLLGILRALSTNDSADYHFSAQALSVEETVIRLP